jgi:PST family polysaccharide transporter
MPGAEAAGQSPIFDAAEQANPHFFPKRSEMTKKPNLLNAIKWSYSGNGGERALSALVTFFLASALGPKDFGVMTLGLVYVAFAQMCLDQGLAAALIQRKDLVIQHLDTVFWTNIAISVALIGLSFGLSDWWADRNHVPELSRVIRVLSLSILIEGLTIVQSALLRKKMDFKSLAIRSNLAAVVGGIVGVMMARTGWGVWALVGQQLGRDIVALILLWKLSSWRPGFHFSISRLRELLSFSTSNFVAQLGTFANGQAGVLLLGLLFGPIPVGLYRLAERLMNTVLTAAASSIQAVSLPEFSRLQDQPSELQRSILNCMRLSCVVTFPMLAGLGATSPILARIMGPRWTPAAGVLSVMSILGMTLVFIFFTGPLLQARGRPLFAAGLEWGRTILTIVTFVGAGWAVRNATPGVQAVGIAWTQLAASALMVAPLYLMLLARMSGLNGMKLAGAIGPSSAAAVATWLGVKAVELVLPGQPLTYVLAGEVALGGAAGITALLTFDAELRRWIGQTGRIRRNAIEGVRQS